MKTAIRLIWLEMRNFLSYGNGLTRINLEFKDPTLIIGRNLDTKMNGQIDSNGSGKTTIVNAIVWGLYGKPLSNIKQDRLVNNINAKNMEIRIVFEKDGKFYKIVRYRSHETLGDAGVRLFEGDTQAEVESAPELTAGSGSKTKEKAESSITLTNKQIERIIGMPFDIFIRLMVYSTRSVPFMELPATSTTSSANQKDIMEELTGLTELSDRGDKLNIELKNNTKEVELLKKIQEEIDRQKSQLSTKIDSIKSRIDQWNAVRSTDIRVTKEKIKKLSSIKFDKQKKYLSDISDKNDSLRDIENDLKIKKMELANITDEIEQINRWEEEQDQRIDDAKIELAVYSNMDYKQQEHILGEIEKITDERDDSKTKIKNYKQEIKEKSDRASELQGELKHLSDNKCPYCLQKYADTENKIGQIEKEISDVNAELSKLSSSVELLSISISDLELRLEENKGKLKFKNLSQLNASRMKCSNAKTILEKLKEETNPYENVDISDKVKTQKAISKEVNKLESDISKICEDIEKITEKLVYSDENELIRDFHRLDTLNIDLERLESSENPHTETLIDLETTEFDESNYEKIEKLETVIAHQKLLYKLLTKKESFIRKFLLKKRIAFLNEKIKEYLGSLGMPHRVKFTEELTISITQFGKQLDFGNLSAGQQARVNIAISVAFRKVLQKRYGEINFWILDECLDSALGTTGVDLAAKLIKKIAIETGVSVFIITHKDEIMSQFPKTLEIELEKGFSKIVKQ